MRKPSYPIEKADITKLKKVLSSDTINFESLLTGETPLHAAVASPFAKRRVIVELLLRKGAGVLLCSADGATPLHLAAQAGHTESVELLLKHGARLNVADIKGWVNTVVKFMYAHIFVPEHV